MVVSSQALADRIGQDVLIGAAMPSMPLSL